MLLSEWKLTKDEIAVRHGAVTAHHRLAALAGLEMLQKGGNAVDAAVATAFVMSVVEFHMSGVGGSGYMLVHLAERGETWAVDFGLRTPMAARPDMFELEPEPRPDRYTARKVKGNLNKDSFLACAVPGEAAGLCTAVERFGTMPRREVMAPAIKLAREGFPMNWFVALSIYNNLQTFRKYPDTAAVYLKGDGTFQAPVLEHAGDLLVQADLARTLEAVAEGGAEAFYRGEIARRIVEHVQANGGILTLEDLARYEASVLPALRSPYRGFEAAIVPEVTGGTLEVQTLNLLERFDLAALDQGSPDALHLIAEACRRAYVDRYTYLGDPRGAGVPYAGLLSKEYGALRSADIVLDRADPDVGPGDPWPFDGAARPAGWTEGRRAEGDGETTHMTAVDEARNVVSMTKTGAYFVIPGTGVMMNVGLRWFDPEPGHPNSIGSWKRHLSSMSPTLLLRGGRAMAAFGSPGAYRIPNSVTQVAINLADFGMGIQAAVAAPKVDCSTARTLIDDRVPQEVRDDLRRRGHRLAECHEEMGFMSFARPNGVLLDEESGLVRAGSYPFFPSAAAGY